MCSRKLTKELCEVIENYGLVNFSTLDIQVCGFCFRSLYIDIVPFLTFIICHLTPFQDKESVGNLVKLIDKTNGYIFAGIEGSVAEFSKIAAAPIDWDYYRYPTLEFKYLSYSFLNISYGHFTLVVSVHFACDGLIVYASVTNTST